MVKLFKKGSYRIPAAAVLITAVLAAGTPVNALGSPVLAAGVNQSVKTSENIIKPKGHRTYHSLDRAVKAAGFPFEAPSLLPKGYQLSSVQLSGEITGRNSERMDYVTLSFEPAVKNRTYSSFGLEAANLKYSKSSKEIVESLKASLQKQKFIIEEKETDVAGKAVLRINATLEDDSIKMALSYFFWERNGISYKLELLNSDFSEQEIEVLISSMKIPDENMRKTYINKDSLMVDVVDGEDLQLAAKAIGFTPKFPLQVSGFTLKSAFVTSKINFSYSRNGKEELTRVLYSEYESSDSHDKKNPQWFKLLQMKDDGQFKTFKANKQVLFFRTDGGARKVSAELIKIGGKEVLRTSPYTSDGGKSSAYNPVWIGYFWLEQGVCYQAVFKKDQVKDPQGAVAALIKTRPVQLAK